MSVVLKKKKQNTQEEAEKKLFEGEKKVKKRCK